jgi:hypothetical protein
MPTENSRFDRVGMDIHIKKRLTIVPIGDIHFNAPMFSESVFRDWCKKYRARVAAGEDIYFLGLGDYLETMSGSERKNSLSGLHESTREWLDEKINENIRSLAERLDFTKGRWLGMLAGNHNYIDGDGNTTTHMLAKLLDAKPLGVVAAIRLGIILPGKKAMCYDIWAHHGRGGGRLAGSTLNSIEAWANGLDGDLILMGHDHKKAAASTIRLSMSGRGADDMDVVQRETWLCRTGSFLKGYEKGKPSYIAERALRPVSLGTIEVNIRRTKTRHETLDDDKIYDRLITEVTL